MIAVLAIAFFVGGCGVPNAEKIQALAAQRQSLLQQADEAQAAIKQMADAMQSAGIVDANMTAKIEKLNADVNKWKAIADTIGEAIEQAKLTGDNNQDLITILQSINAASATFNPYAAPVGAGLGLLSLILGWIARREAEKRKEAEEKKNLAESTVNQISTMHEKTLDKLDETAQVLEKTQAKYQAHKQGVELTMKEVAAAELPAVKAVEVQLYSNIGAARQSLGIKA